MSFLSGFAAVIHVVEKDAVKVFDTVFKIAVAAQPTVDLALAATGNGAIALLYNQTVAAVGVAENAATAAGLQASGSAKQAAVIASIAASVDAIDKQFGIKVDVAPWVNAAVASVKALSVVPVLTPNPPTAPSAAPQFQPIAIPAAPLPVTAATPLQPAI